MFEFKDKTKEPEKVVDHLEEKISYKIFGIIFAGVIAFQLYLNTYKNPDDPQLSFIVTLASFLTPVFAGCVGLVVARRYWNSEIFGKSYLALSIGFLMNGAGELVYYFLEQTGEVPSPSIADVLFLSFYFLLFYHLAKNIAFFKPKITFPIKALIIGIPIAIVSVYAILEYGQEQAADLNFYLGLAYVVGSAVTLTGSILGAIIFRQGLLGTAWLVLTIGIVITTAGDNWYSYLDVYNQYTLTHLVNLLWYAGYLVSAYALYKHRKVI